VLQKLDASQPIAGAELVVLSEHVDYWNHDGWKDPYSSSAWSERQSAYAQALHTGDVYTPQLIADGTTELRLGNEERVRHLLQQAAAGANIPVRIESVTVEGNSPALLRGHIAVDGASQRKQAGVYVAIALNRAESQVLQGENRGRHLTHVAVLKNLKGLGSVQAGKSFERDFELKLDASTDPTNVRIIAFVQEPGPGKVVGVALRKSPF
jgi:hypothetical protein